MYPENLPTAVIRCDASLEIGTGHVMRCLTLAHALRDTHKVFFYTGQETLQTVPALANSDFNLINAPPPAADLLVIDHYGLDKIYERQARDWAKRIMVIDDLADRQHDCDILLDQTFGRHESEYRGLVPAGCRILAGTSFALLRPEFSALRQQSGGKERQAHSKRVLVCFGGINPKSSTQLALRVLERYTQQPLNIDVVLGKQAHKLNEVKDIVANINQSGLHTAEAHINTPDMARLMANSDLCLGAGGTISWERCCLGLPAITLELADNQKNVLKQLDHAGAILNLGSVEDVSEDYFLSKLSALLNDPDALAAMKSSASRICDGLGAIRTLPYLLTPESAKDSSQVTIRPMHNYDCEQLFIWQNIEEVRRFARNPKPPGLEEHANWFRASLASPKRLLLMVECAGKPAGMVRLDEVESDGNGTFEVSILIDPAFHGNGVGSAALRLLSKLKPRDCLKAEVLPGNLASQKLFEKAGYKTVSDTWYEFSPEYSET